MRIINRNVRKIGKRADINHGIGVTLFIIAITYLCLGGLYVVEQGTVQAIMSEMTDSSMHAIADYRYVIIFAGVILASIAVFANRRAEQAQEFLERPTTIPRDWKRR